LQRSQGKREESDVKSYLKATLLILIAYAAAGCVQNRQSVTSHRPDPEPSSVVSSSNHLEETSALAAEYAGNRAGLKQTPPASQVGLHISREARRESKNTQPILDEALEFCQTSQDFWGQGDFENAIAALDQAYNLILRADTNDNPKFIQQKEDIRFMIGKRMLEIYASRHIVATGNHHAIPMVMNQHVEKEIKLFQGREKEFFVSSHKRSGRYRPEILKALKEAGLPRELSWLPLIESGFKVKALSRARALGLWQFIPSTGYKFGLKRDEWIDERMDVTKSTLAAIDYLKELHNIFGAWMTVLAGYNCGEAKVLRVIRNQNINYLDNFWDVFEKLPWETARYVPRFLAALFIINDPNRFGFDLKALDLPQCGSKISQRPWASLVQVLRISTLNSATRQRHLALMI
jgi:membrane-bound lytic murein transglycosylase D